LVKLDVDVLEGERTGGPRRGELPPEPTGGLPTPRELPPAAARLACTNFAMEYG
jgi:hypothetical protein